MISIVSDLLLTDSFLIKGQIDRKHQRLSQMLDEHRKLFLPVRDATLVDLATKDRIHTPFVHVNVDEILLAHEFLDEAGDPIAKRLAASEQPVRQRVRVFYTGNLNVEVAGNVRPGSYEVDDPGSRRFFVMQGPQVRGLEAKDDPDLGLLGELSYAILNKERLSYVYDFNEL